MGTGARDDSLPVPVDAEAELGANTTDVERGGMEAEAEEVEADDVEALSCS